MYNSNSTSTRINHENTKYIKKQDMEEVDNIIIDTLKNLNCNSIDDDVQNLNQFTPEIVTDCIVTCLECVVPDLKISHKLPPSMSLRLKIATDIAEQITKLGYRGDMGYQTILYCNEVDLRRVLMFLIERLPKETSKLVSGEDAGYVPRLIRKIAKTLQLTLDKPWVPVGILKDGCREYDRFIIKQTSALSIPLKTYKLNVPDFNSEASDSLKHYWIHNLPIVTKQTDMKSLIPSLLFCDNEYHYDEELNLTETIEAINSNNCDPTPSVIINHQEQRLSESIHEATSEIQEERISKLEALIKEVDMQQKSLQKYMEECNYKEISVKNLQERLREEENLLSNLTTKIKVKTKALNVMSKEEHMLKLRSLVENGNERLLDLANQWNEVQLPLLDQYRSLQNSLTSQEIKMQDKLEKSNKIKEKLKAVMEELKTKEHLEQQLIEENTKINKNTNRSVYTRKILEIIGNIKKQDEEIQKILKDTKEVQKDLNNLNGQLDRSFTLSDELIFRDAKSDEMARKAYKLLAALHKDCNEIVSAITNLGVLEREYRHLEEQVETEISKEYGTKLQRVNKDLQEIKKELAMLVKEQN